MNLKRYLVAIEYSGDKRLVIYNQTYQVSLSVYEHTTLVDIVRRAKEELSDTMSLPIRNMNTKGVTELPTKETTT